MMFASKVHPGHPDFLDLPWMESIVEDRAEIALVVHPAWQRCGLGTRLLDLLTAVGASGVPPRFPSRIIKRWLPCWPRLVSARRR